MSAPTIDAPASWPDITAYAVLLGVPRSWVRDAVTARRIHHRRVGRHVRFSPEDQAKNAAMWATEPIKTPTAAVVRIPIPTARRRAS